METTHPIYFFGGGTADGRATDKMLLGGKGANLAEMSALGLPVPPGCTLTTTVCTDYYACGAQLPAYLDQALPEAIAKIEQLTGKQFGGTENPLLLSVRSGAAISMPGMMDTILNLGLNDKTVEALAHKSGNARFAYDSYRRFIQMFGQVVLGLDHHVFEHELDLIKETNGYASDTQMTVEDLQNVVERYKARLLEHGKSFPQDPQEQLRTSVNAVFASWNNERACVYRAINNMPSDMGTAVNVQAMVFGNMGDTSATGVAFTRNPSTGEKYFFGEFLLNAQGEDVVAGTRTPQPLNNAPDSLEAAMPEAYSQLDAIQQQLELHYTDMQDIEFTIEDGTLYLLQTRRGKRTARAMVRIAVDMVAEGLITKEQAIARIDAEKLNELLHPTIADDAVYESIAKGLPASPGVATGRVVFSAEDAEEIAGHAEKCILVRVETSPEDIKGMYIAEGILTARGGMTSHAAVVARGMGKCCVSGCGDVQIDYAAQQMVVMHGTTSHIIKRGDWLSLNGATGEIILGQVDTMPPSIDQNFEQILAWSDELRELGVRTNADTPEAAQQAAGWGAEGIGLCRTEHMFFDETRIRHMRAMILANTSEQRAKALAELLPHQRADFEAIFTAMDGHPVTVRLLDPPLHEFLPEHKTEIKLIARDLGVRVEQVYERLHSLEELNPMLGLRGCRLGLTMPEITEMQARAIIEAALDATAKGVVVKPEIMVPLVGFAEELRLQRALIERVIADVFAERGTQIEYLIGTMIELPRACLTADKVAQHADFFSFGTNDLTQTTLGLSRDDSGKFLPQYVEMGIMGRDPFVALDESGVGQLVEMAIEKGRGIKPGLKTGICGEHGGEPGSIQFVAAAGISYVSCSPFRVPIARVAAAQAALQKQA